MICPVRADRLNSQKPEETLGVLTQREPMCAKSLRQTSMLNRSSSPMESASNPEPKVANYVLDKIYASDAIQYNALLKSIREPERVA